LDAWRRSAGWDGGEGSWHSESSEEAREPESVSRAALRALQFRASDPALHTSDGGWRNKSTMVGRRIDPSRNGTRRNRMTEERLFDHQQLPGAKFHGCGLVQAEFDNVDMSQSKFKRVNLWASSFTDINFQGAKFSNVSFANVSIEDANIDGLTIFGWNITALIKDAQKGKPSN
jgi:uncharacterized protein YjbI with pentapeptide repeats